MVASGAKRPLITSRGQNGHATPEGSGGGSAKADMLGSITVRTQTRPIYHRDAHGTIRLRVARTTVRTVWTERSGGHGILAHFEFASQEGTLSMKTIRSPMVAEAPPQTWSNMKVANGYFHIAGMTGSGPKGEHPGDDMYIQAKSIFQKFKDLLGAAGGKMNDIMSITVYVTNLDENTEVWRARREFFTGDFPCSTLIEVKRVGSPKASPPLKVEINATGVIGADG
jgi:enamine deaminase RidA (YjgF/YER057c/UK114 family)